MIVEKKLSVFSNADSPALMEDGNHKVIFLRILCFTLVVMDPVLFRMKPGQASRKTKNIIIETNTNKHTQAAHATHRAHPWGEDDCVPQF